MFLKANNHRVHIGAVSRKATKAIHLHYGSKDGNTQSNPDEWRQGAQAVVAPK